MKYYLTLSICILSLVVTFSLTACNLANLLASTDLSATAQVPTVSAPEANPTSQVNPAGLQASPTPMQPERQAYPATPEEVVKAFVALYPDSPEQMMQYLSTNLSAKLPKSGPMGLLKFNGALSGFNIDSASVNPDPAGAIVKIRAEVGGGVKTRTFILVKEGGRWVIDAVRVPKQ